MPARGLCISRTVHDHVEARIAPRFRATGFLTLKNLKRPIEAYCLSAEEISKRSDSFSTKEHDLSDATRAAAVAGLRTPYSNRAPRNSIAVLPFASIGSDTIQEYFAEGVVDDIITELSHFRHLFVIARNSSLFIQRPER